MSSYNKDVSRNKLRKLREDRKLSIAQLSEQSGVTTHRLQRLEDGSTVPSIHEMRQLAKALAGNEVTKVETTQRGFKCINFQDRYDVACSMQKSSLATEDCIWFGCNKPNARVPKPGEGWVAVELPAGCVTDTRMHLTQQQIKALLPHLQAFAQTGDIEIKPPTKSQLWRRVARLAGEAVFIGGPGEATFELGYDTDKPVVLIRSLITRLRQGGEPYGNERKERRIADKLEAALTLWETA